MWSAMGRWTVRIFRTLRMALLGPQLFAFIPALCLAGYWYGPEAILVSMAVVLPLAIGMVNSIARPLGAGWQDERLDPVTRLPLRGAVLDHLEKAFEQEPSTGKRSAVVVFELDDFAKTVQTHGQDVADSALKILASRLAGSTRSADILARMDGVRFALALAPSMRTDLESMIQVAARIQSAVSEPIQTEATKINLNCSVGFCIPRRASEKNAEACLEAAEVALTEAQAHSSGSVRAYSANGPRKRVVRGGLVGEVEAALEEGQIKPWFQMQLSTDDGQVSGVEALARWHHPTHGVILPGAFLPAISAAGLTARLGEIILLQSLEALCEWDRMGIRVPNVGVNFSSEDLSEPGLADRVSWELDRLQLDPGRLTIEVLETVVADDANDIITRNILRLSELGCQIDLDDFGTGHASIVNIRRFCVNRIKIDRVFVKSVDTDREQQQVLTAILEMANRMDIETLAEGVETPGEHALLSQLGCGYVQGYQISRPIPFEEATNWLHSHFADALQIPSFARKNDS